MKPKKQTRHQELLQYNQRLLFKALALTGGALNLSREFDEYKVRGRSIEGRGLVLARVESNGLLEFKNISRLVFFNEFLVYAQVPTTHALIPLPKFEYLKSWAVIDIIKAYPFKFNQSKG